MKRRAVMLLLMVCCTMTACKKTSGQDVSAVDSLALAEEGTMESQYSLVDHDRIQDSMQNEESNQAEQTQHIQESSTASIEDSILENDYYSVCTSYSKEEVENFAKEVKEAVTNQDYEYLSKVIAYPITIGGTEYMDADGFCTEAPEFGQDFIDKMRQVPTTNLFYNWQGIMLGDGEVWISEVLNDRLEAEGLMVIGINI